MRRALRRLFHAIARHRREEYRCVGRPQLEYGAVGHVNECADPQVPEITQQGGRPTGPGAVSGDDECRVSVIRVLNQDDVSALSREHHPNGRRRLGLTIDDHTSGSWDTRDADALSLPACQGGAGRESDKKYEIGSHRAGRCANRKTMSSPVMSPSVESLGVLYSLRRCTSGGYTVNGKAMERRQKYAIPGMGARFGRWTVVGGLSRNTFGQKVVAVRCECGNTNTLTPSALRKSGSCGCAKGEASRRALWKHGEGRTALYNRWAAMVARCGNPNVRSYRDYGARGIQVCAEWRADFRAFRDWALTNGYAQSLELDRIDVNGNYEPANCRFVTKQANARNRRTTRLIEAFGDSRPLNAWLDDPRCVVSRSTFTMRLGLGWDTERALTQPRRRQA